MLKILGIICFAIFTPLCWVRKLEKFNWTHIIADMLILLTSIIVLVFAFIRLGEYGWGEGLEAINTKTFANSISFAVYSYEGIGIIIPVMDITEDKEKFPKVLVAVLTTVFVTYLGFGEICYLIYGNLVAHEPLITSIIGNSNPVVWVIKILFSINLFFTYPLIIHPANIIIESYLFGKMGKSL